MHDDTPRGRSGERHRRQPIHCDECTIVIGEGYQESIPFEFEDDSGSIPRVLTVCWRCWESLNRRRLKRLAQHEGSCQRGPL